MIHKDEQEDFEKNRDQLEYLASFTNYAAVEKVRGMRSGKDMVANVSDEDFLKVIEGMSGRAAPVIGKQS